MAISAERLKPSQSNHGTEPAQNSFLQRLVDEGTLYVPQALSAPQFATLSALMRRLTRQTDDDSAHLAAGVDQTLASGASLTPPSTAYPLGLEELDSLARTRAGYAFAELTPEIQDAMLDLIATGDLSTKRLNLALWLEDVRSSATPTLAAR